MIESPSYSVSKPGENEECFSISLPVCVQGKDALGQKFKEETSLKQISSEKALFELKTRVLIGTKLQASLLVPKTLFLQHPLKLIVLGEVVKAVTDSTNHNEQNVFLKLDKKFSIEKINNS